MNELKPPMLKREDYRAIKHMNREDMTKYLYRVYRRGFDAGVESTKGNHQAFHRTARTGADGGISHGKKCAAQSEKAPIRRSL